MFPFTIAGTRPDKGIWQRRSFLANLRSAPFRRREYRAPDPDRLEETEGLPIGRYSPSLEDRLVYRVSGKGETKQVEISAATTTNLAR